MFYRLTKLETTLLAGATGAEVEFLFPQRGLLRGFWLSTQSGLVVDRGGLSVAMLRRAREVIANDEGRAFMTSLDACGPVDYAPDWCALAMPVETQEPWIVQLSNVGPNPVVPRLIFEVAL